MVLRRGKIIMILFIKRDMNNFSFFYGIGSAGNVRGKQIADILGAKQNPTEGFEDDICIYVKVLPPENHPKYTYLDVDDATGAVEWLKTHTDTGVIANSLLGQAYLSILLKRKDIKVIPHAHVNYENWIRPDRPVKTVGIIGSKTSFMYPIEDIRKKLADIGLELIYNRDYWKFYGDEEGMTEDARRQKIVDFYKGIDIQIVWRPDNTFSKQQKPLKNPNKLVNAASFGIPTVSYPEEAFKECITFYEKAYDIEDLVDQVRELKEDNLYYKELSNDALEGAENYHISKIKELYLSL